MSGGLMSCGLKSGGLMSGVLKSYDPLNQNYRSELQMELLSYLQKCEAIHFF